MVRLIVAHLLARDYGTLCAMVERDDTVNILIVNRNDNYLSICVHVHKLTATS